MRKRTLIRALLTDEHLADPLPFAEGLPRGSWVVLRFRSPKPPLYTEALRGLCKRRRLVFFVANDLPLAVRLRADGIHLSEALAAHANQSALLAWRRTKPGRLLTAAAHSAKALIRARQIGVDAVYLSPIFETQSHPGAAALGLVQARRLVRKAGLPVLALGGITPRRIRLVEGMGVAGLASAKALFTK